MSVDTFRDADTLRKFVSELHHELRNPLSVISNELYLLKENSEGAALALKKVRYISELLSEIDSSLGLEQDIGSGNVADLLRGVCEKVGKS